MPEKEKNPTIITPIGRLINASLFEKDKFDPEATAAYKIEMAFNPADIADVEEALAAAADAKWGDGAGQDYIDGKIRDPILDGDKLAARREAKGKPGEAYRGKLIIRAHTIFNRHGHDGSGGIQVYGVDVEKIEPVTQHEIYNGCFGKAALNISGYTNNEGDNALMFYLSAFQKTGEGEPLMSATDYSEVFQPVGRKEGEGASRRRSRAG